jgi:uncharacterized protein with HEPN domain
MTALIASTEIGLGRLRSHKLFNRNSSRSRCGDCACRTGTHAPSPYSASGSPHEQDHGISSLRSRGSLFSPRQRYQLAPAFPTHLHHPIASASALPHAAEETPQAWKVTAEVQQAADAIDQFIAGLDAAGYEENTLVLEVVERQFEIIGEALNQLSKISPGLARRVPDLREIIGFRNNLIHGYTAIDHGRVWQIAQTSLPGLRGAVSALLVELGQPYPRTLNAFSSITNVSPTRF